MPMGIEKGPPAGLDEAKKGSGLVLSAKHENGFVNRVGKETGSYIGFMNEPTEEVSVISVPVLMLMDSLLRSKVGHVSGGGVLTVIST